MVSKHPSIQYTWHESVAEAGFNPAYQWTIIDATVYPSNGQSSSQSTSLAEQQSTDHFLIESVVNDSENPCFIVLSDPRMTVGEEEHQIKRLQINGDHRLYRLYRARRHLSYKSTNVEIITQKQGDSGAEALPTCTLTRIKADIELIPGPEQSDFTLKLTNLSIPEGLHETDVPLQLQLSNAIDNVPIYPFTIQDEPNAGMVHQVGEKWFYYRREGNSTGRKSCFGILWSWGRSR